MTSDSEYNSFTLQYQLESISKELLDRRLLRNDYIVLQSRLAKALSESLDRLTER